MWVDRWDRCEMDVRTVMKMRGQRLRWYGHFVRRPEIHPIRWR